jgi:hypothetical protein
MASGKSPNRAEHMDKIRFLGGKLGNALATEYDVSTVADLLCVLCVYLMILLTFIFQSYHFRQAPSLYSRQLSRRFHCQMRCRINLVKNLSGYTKFSGK